MSGPDDCLATFLESESECNFNFKQCRQCKLTSKTTHQSTITLFLKAVSVWIKKPHVVNRRLCGAKFLSIHQINTSEGLRLFLIEHVRFLASTKAYCEQFTFEDLSTETSPFTVITRELIPKSEFFPKVLEILIYDSTAKTVYFIPVTDGERSTDDNKSYSTKEISYSVHFKSSDNESERESSNEIVMSWSCDHDQPEVPKRQLSSKWLSSILLEKLSNWSTISDISTSVTSLQLVDVEEYQKTYSRLKNTYGRDLVKNWTETTDPQKFVYEDIAIASYLLLIWEEDRRLKNLSHRQSFVDLGCGNGLLVYILTKEGHKGLGIDLRKRKIWDTFGSDVNLQESMVIPSGDNLFPDYDWIIGNHSDELTPWIPVIAARSSYDCCFFVLPCCHYDFVGKFTHSEKGKSKYASYLNYVENVVSICGFNPECDTLRIPSTKRISYIGRYRTYSKCDEEEADKRRQSFIDSRTKQISAKNIPAENNVSNSKNEDNNCVSTTNSYLSSSDIINFELSTEMSSKDKKSSLCSKSCELTNNDSDDKFHGQSTCKKCKVEERLDGKCDSSTSSSQWVSGFKPRVEAPVRNCQRVSNETKQNIVDAVFKKVLAADKDNTATLPNGGKWCKGGVVPLGHVVALFDKSVLQELKSECGGLQTLLRNHSHVFQVTGGNVRLRDFTLPDPWIGSNPQKSKDKKRNTIKTTLCWFHNHHPDGCPKESSDCLFAHGQDDLRQKIAKVEEDAVQR